MPLDESAHKSKEDKKDRHQRRHHHHHHRHHRSHDEKTAGVEESAVAQGPNGDEVEDDWNTNRERVEQLCQQYPNNVCNDCNSCGTRWASVNHGVFLCIRCSGIHRSLGVHVTKVKSTNMDKWQASEVRLMEAIGNQKGKALYEARVPKDMRPLTGGEPESTIRAFIQQKYQDKSFAVGDVIEQLRQYHKATRYGKGSKRVLRPSQGRGTDVSARDDIAQRDDAMKALYGVNAENMARKTKRAITKPLSGPFGDVNVPATEYEERRRVLFTHFQVEA